MAIDLLFCGHFGRIATLKMPDLPSGIAICKNKYTDDSFIVRINDMGLLKELTDTEKTNIIFSCITAHVRKYKFNSEEYSLQFIEGSYENSRHAASYTLHAKKA